MPPTLAAACVFVADFALVADVDAFRAVRGYLAHDGRAASTGTAALLALGIAAGLVWAGFGARALWARPSATAAAPRTGLFDELCRAHELSPADQALLLRAAGTASASLAFVEPEHLGRLATGADAAAAAALSGRLFGDAVATDGA